VRRGGGIGLGTSGSGDVLAGWSAARRRGGEPAQAAAWGQYLHCAAGDLLTAAWPVGLPGRELLDEVPTVPAPSSALTLPTSVRAGSRVRCGYPGRSGPTAPCPERNPHELAARRPRHHAGDRRRHHPSRRDGVGDDQLLEQVAEQTSNDLDVEGAFERESDGAATDTEAAKATGDELR
jgi:hypothetical protein